MKKLFIIFIVTLTMLPIFSNGTSEESEKISVAVSIIPQKAFIEAIAKDKVDVVTLIPKGASPENYEPTPKQRIEFENSKLYFSIGVPSEEFYILPMLNKNTKAIYLADEINKTYPAIYIGDEKDPHIWLSPKRVLLMIDIMVRELSLIDSDNSQFYKDNAKEYKDKINNAINDINNSLSSYSNNSFLVYHPAFNYFAQDFNLNMISIEQEGKEITPKSLIQTIDLAKSLNIKDIYYQAEIASEKSIAISKELGGDAILLDPLSYNYVDNLVVMANKFKERF